MFVCIGTTPLYYASQSGHLRVVEELVQCHEANPLAVSKDGMTASHVASQSGQVEVLQVSEEYFEVLRLH